MHSGAVAGESEVNMNIPLVTPHPIMCVGKKKTLGSDNKTYFYTVAIATDDGDAGSLSCSEEVYDSIVPYHAYVFETVYRDGQYKGLRIVAAFSEEFYEDRSSSAPAEPVKEDAAASSSEEPAAKKTAKGK